LRGAESLLLNIFVRGGEFDAAAGPSENVQVVVDADAAGIGRKGWECSRLRTEEISAVLLPREPTRRVELRQQPRARNFDLFGCFRKIRTRDFERSIAAQRQSNRPIQLRRP